ncbi:hypothetical protein HN51_019899 [Arachis hypogaea]
MESRLGVVPETYSDAMDTPRGSGLRIYFASGRHHNQREGSRISGHLSWGSALLCHTYPSLCTTTGHDVTNTVGCMPLFVSCIYHRFPYFGPAGYDVIRFSLATRLARLGQQSRDRHDGRIQTLRHRIDGLTFD